MHSNEDIQLRMTVNLQNLEMEMSIHPKYLALVGLLPWNPRLFQFSFSYLLIKSLVLPKLKL
jgi:hypothetical protein